MDKVLQAYNIDSQFPSEWNHSNEDRADSTAPPNRGRTRGGAAQEALTHQLMSSWNTRRVASDERDPLGISSSVLSVLRAKGIDVDSDPATKAKYLLSSTKFSARSFLHDVHGDTSYSDLKIALDHLQKTISSQNDSLRTLVDDDYERFVNTKRNLDDVMRQLASSRITEKDGGGINHLKAKLDEATNKFTILNRPLEELSSQRSRYQTSLQVIDDNKYIFDLPAILKKHVDNSEHHDFMRDYRRGADEITILTDPSNSPECHRIARLIDENIRNITDSYRQKVWNLLFQAQVDKNYTRYFDMLLDLGVDENPAYKWMVHQATVFKGEIDDFFNRLKVETGVIALNSGQGKSIDVVSWALRLNISKDDLHEGSDGPELVDTTEITGLWSRYLEMFTEFREIVERATVFWRECLIILSGGRKLDPTLKLNTQQENDVKERFYGLTSAISSRLDEWLNMPTTGTSVLPIASAHESERSHQVLAFIPANANALSVARYVSRILSTLSIVGSELSELLGPQNLYSVSLKNVRQLFVTSISNAWSRDSMKLGYIQDFQNGTIEELQKVPAVYGKYHYWILKHIRNMADPSIPDLGTYVEGQVSSALSLSLRSLQSTLAEHEVEEATTQDDAMQALRPQPLSSDTKLLLTMHNFAGLEARVIPDIYSSFRRSFKIRDNTVNPSVVQTLKEVQNSLFELYVRKKKTVIHKTIMDEIVARNEQLLSNEVPTRISSSTYECLMVVVDTHSKFHELHPSMLREALQILHQNLLTSFLAGIREVDHLGKFGVLQFVADVEFIRSVLQKLRTQATQKSVQLIYDSLKDSSIDRTLWKGEDGPREFIRDVIERALQQESLAFMCFNSVDSDTDGML